MENQDPPFRYSPECAAPSCDHPPVYKIAAPWSDGVSRELKNYGLACEAHKDQQLARAKQRRDQLRLAVGETVGPVGVYRLASGCKDSELERLPE